MSDVVKNNVEKGELTEIPTNVSCERGDVIERRFSIVSALGIGYSVTNTAMAVLASLASGIGSGGPVLYIYGQIVMFLVAICIAITLGELASAMPNAAGQFHWVSQLAPKNVRAGLAYTTDVWVDWNHVHYCIGDLDLTSNGHWHIHPS